MSELLKQEDGCIHSRNIGALIDLPQADSFVRLNRHLEQCDCCRNSLAHMNQQQSMIAGKIPNVAINEIEMGSFKSELREMLSQIAILKEETIQYKLNIGITIFVRDMKDLFFSKTLLLLYIIFSVGYAIWRWFN